MQASDRRRTPPIPSPLGRLVEPLYRFAVDRANRRYDSGRGVTRLAVPVISIGNITVGGTGKTPMVTRMVEWLLDAGHQPLIAMRGYKPRGAAFSDEEQQYRDRFASQPVSIVAQPDRLAGIKPLLDQKQADCVILDDGFQHRRIARDLDLVLIDASRDDVFANRCLPAGWLREPVESLKRASHIILTHTEVAWPLTTAMLDERLVAITGKPSIAHTRHLWEEALIGKPPEPLTYLDGRRIIAACGIGHPTAFLASLQTAGAVIAAHSIKRDHHNWQQADIDELLELTQTHDASAVITTEKDLVKLRQSEIPSNLLILAPRLRLQFERGEDSLREAILSTAAGDAS